MSKPRSFRGMMTRILLGKDEAEALFKAMEISADLPDRLDRIDNALLGGGSTISGATVNDETAMRYAAVNTAVRILSETFAMLPFKLKAIDPNNPEITKDATDHPLYNVLRRMPNSFQTAYEFWRLAITLVLLRGNFYALITRNGNDQAAELIPMSPDRIRVSQNDDYSLTYTYTPKRGGEITLEQGEVLHLRAPGNDGIEGKSVIQRARESIGIGIQAERYAASSFKNGVRKAVVLKHPEVLNDEVADRLGRSFDKAYSGVSNAHKTIVLEEGVELDTISMTHEDAQFLEQRKYQRSEILAIFGIPPHMAGDTEKTTSWGTGIEQQTIGFVTFTMVPWATLAEQAVYRDCLTPKERKKYYPSMNVDAIIRGDILSRYKAHEIGLKNKFLTKNEVRGLEGRNPVPGGDTFEDPAPDKPTTPDDPKPGDEQ